MPTSTGVLTASKVGRKAQFTHLECSYPLKFMTTKCFHPLVLCVYINNYGGGLLHNDQVNLVIAVESKVNLVAFTQAATNIYKTPSASSSILKKNTKQTLQATIHPHALFINLPKPIVCFEASRYEQVLDFTLLDTSAGLINLDWYTAGRMALEEWWKMDYYASRTSLRLSSSSVMDTTTATTARLVYRDAVILDKSDTLCKFGHFACYATLILYGRHSSLSQLIIDILSKAQHTYKHAEDILWSASETSDGEGLICKFAGISIDVVRDTLYDLLGEVEQLCGSDLWGRSPLDNQSLG